LSLWVCFCVKRVLFYFIFFNFIYFFVTLIWISSSESFLWWISQWFRENQFDFRYKSFFFLFWFTITSNVLLYLSFLFKCFNVFSFYEILFCNKFRNCFNIFCFNVLNNLYSNNMFRNYRPIIRPFVWKVLNDFHHNFKWNYFC